MKDDSDADPLVTRAQPTVSHVAADSSSHNRDCASDLGRLEVRCPNCHVPTEVAVDTVGVDLTCSTCGSRFNVISPPTRLGHFELIEQLGVGGFGAVWKARDTQLDRLVAVKIPRKGQLDADEIEDFLREAKTVAQLRHPNIVSIHGHPRTRTSRRTPEKQSRVVVNFASTCRVLAFLEKSPSK